MEEESSTTQSRGIDLWRIVNDEDFELRKHLWVDRKRRTKYDPRFSGPPVVNPFYSPPVKHDWDLVPPLWAFDSTGKLMEARVKLELGLITPDEYLEEREDFENIYDWMLAWPDEFLVRRCFCTKLLLVYHPTTCRFLPERELKDQPNEEESIDSNEIKDVETPILPHND